MGLFVFLSSFIVHGRKHVSYCFITYHSVPLFIGYLKKSDKGAVDSLDQLLLVSFS